MPIAVHGMNPVVDAATGKVWVIGGGTNGGYGMSSIVQAFDLAVYTAKPVTNTEPGSPSPTPSHIRTPFDHPT